MDNVLFAIGTIALGARGTTVAPFGGWLGPKRVGERRHGRDQSGVCGREGRISLDELGQDGFLCGCRCGECIEVLVEGFSGGVWGAPEGAGGGVYPALPASWAAPNWSLPPAARRETFAWWSASL